MVMDEKMDEGSIVEILPIPIDVYETASSLFTKFGVVSGSFAIETIRNLEKGIQKPIPQNHSEATYCSKIAREDGKLDFTKSAKELYHTWQAFTPWPGIFTEYVGKRLVIEECAYHDEPNTHNIGTIVRLREKTVGVVCDK